MYDLGLLVEWGITTCVESKVLSQVEQEAILVTQLCIVSLPLVTCIAANDIGVFISRIDWDDLHQDDILTRVLVLFSVSSRLHLFVVSFLLLNEVFQLMTVIVRVKEAFARDRSLSVYHIPGQVEEQ